jgi:predicted MFS family arabinose efflux permease
MNQRKHYFMLPLIIINVLIIVDAGFLMPLWSDFVRQIGGDLRTAGNAICIFSIIIGVFTCVAAKIENKIKRDEVFVVFAQGFMAIGYIGYFFVHHPWQLYLVQAWLGIGGAIQAPALYAMYHNYMPAEKSTSNWGIWTGFYNISIGIGSLISAYVTQATDFYTTFALMFVIASVGFIYAFVVAIRYRRFFLAKMTGKMH